MHNTSTITRCISISVFTSLIGIPIGITSSAIGLQIYPITAGIKKYKSIIIIRKKKGKHERIEVLNSKALIAYGDFKDLARRTAFDIILHNKAFNPNLGGGGGGVVLPPPCWFSLNNSETVKATTLAFCCIQ